MNPPTHFISCDWGTTNFRLRVIAMNDLKVLVEHTTDVGVRNLNDRFLKSGKEDRFGFFASYLLAQLEALPADYRLYPIVASGMASANIGMKDLAYGKLPLEKTGATLLFEDIEIRSGQQLCLISGLKSETGMMRGEETQALGLLGVLDSGKDGVLLLPGTHSKHLAYRAGRFTDFTSHMTGELFEVISKHSILANSVAAGEWNDRTAACFAEGVTNGFRDGFSPHLFSIRAGQVLRQADTTDNFYQLSGLLIGDELRHLPDNASEQLYLAGAGPLLSLYRFAMETLGFLSRVTVFDDAVLGHAFLSGQRQLLLQTK